MLHQQLCIRLMDTAVLKCGAMCFLQWFFLHIIVLGIITLDLWLLSRKDLIVDVIASLSGLLENHS